MICLALIMIIFAFIGYAMTLSDFEYLHISGLIIVGFCLLAFITEFILYCIFHRKDKENE